MSEGTANQVLQHYYEMYEHSVTERESQINGMCLQAVGHMHTELSREARVIIGGIRKWRASLEGQEGFDASREALDDDIAQLVRFSHRLGLDLESEDTE